MSRIKDWAARLGLSLEDTELTAEAIRQAFHACARKNHTDRSGAAMDMGPILAARNGLLDYLRAREARLAGGGGGGGDMTLFIDLPATGSARSGDLGRELVALERIDWLDLVRSSYWPHRGRMPIAKAIEAWRTLPRYEEDQFTGLLDQLCEIPEAWRLGLLSPAVLGHALDKTWAIAHQHFIKTLLKRLDPESPDFFDQLDLSNWFEVMKRRSIPLPEGLDWHPWAQVTYALEDSLQELVVHHWAMLKEPTILEALNGVVGDRQADLAALLAQDLASLVDKPLSEWDRFHKLTQHGIRYDLDDYDAQDILKIMSSLWSYECIFDLFFCARDAILTNPWLYAKVWRNAQTPDHFHKLTRFPTDFLEKLPIAIDFKRHEFLIRDEALNLPPDTPEDLTTRLQALHHWQTTAFGDVESARQAREAVGPIDWEALFASDQSLNPCLLEEAFGHLWHTWHERYAPPPATRAAASHPPAAALMPASPATCLVPTTRHVASMPAVRLPFRLVRAPAIGFDWWSATNPHIPYPSVLFVGHHFPGMAVLPALPGPLLRLAPTATWQAPRRALLDRQAPPHLAPLPEPTFAFATAGVDEAMAPPAVADEAESTFPQFELTSLGGSAVEFPATDLEASLAASLAAADDKQSLADDGESDDSSTDAGDVSEAEGPDSDDDDDTAPQPIRSWSLADRSILHAMLARPEGLDFFLKTIESAGPDAYPHFAIMFGDRCLHSEWAKALNQTPNRVIRIWLELTERWSSTTHFQPAPFLSLTELTHPKHMEVLYRIMTDYRSSSHWIRDHLLKQAGLALGLQGTSTGAREEGRVSLRPDPAYEYFRDANLMAKNNQWALSAKLLVNAYGSGYRKKGLIELGCKILSHAPSITCIPQASHITETGPSEYMEVPFAHWLAALPVCLSSETSEQRDYFRAILDAISDPDQREILQLYYGDVINADASALSAYLNRQLASRDLEDIRLEIVNHLMTRLAVATQHCGDRIPEAAYWLLTKKIPVLTWLEQSARQPGTSLVIQEMAFQLWLEFQLQLSERPQAPDAPPKPSLTEKTCLFFEPFLGRLADGEAASSPDTRLAGWGPFQQLLDLSPIPRSVGWVGLTPQQPRQAMELRIKLLAYLGVAQATEQRASIQAELLEAWAEPEFNWSDLNDQSCLILLRLPSLWSWICGKHALNENALREHIETIIETKLIGGQPIHYSDARALLQLYQISIDDWQQRGTFVANDLSLDQLQILDQILMFDDGNFANIIKEKTIQAAKREGLNLAGNSRAFAELMWIAFWPLRSKWPLTNEAFHPIVQAWLASNPSPFTWMRALADNERCHFFEGIEGSTIVAEGQALLRPLKEALIAHMRDNVWANDLSTDQCLELVNQRTFKVWLERAYPAELDGYGEVTRRVCQALGTSGLAGRALNADTLHSLALAQDHPTAGLPTHTISLKRMTWAQRTATAQLLNLDLGTIIDHLLGHPWTLPALLKLPNLDKPAAIPYLERIQARMLEDQGEAAFGQSLAHALQSATQALPGLRLPEATATAWIAEVVRLCVNQGLPQTQRQTLFNHGLWPRAERSIFEATAAWAAQATDIRDFCYRTDQLRDRFATFALPPSVTKRLKALAPWPHQILIRRRLRQRWGLSSQHPGWSLGILTLSVVNATAVMAMLGLGLGLCLLPATVGVGLLAAYWVLDGYSQDTLETWLTTPPATKSHNIGQWQAPGSTAKALNTDRHPRARRQPAL